MPLLLRGQIYLADLDPVRGHEQAGVRPVLILSGSSSNASSNMAIILPMTSARQRLKFPYAMRLRSVTMRRPSWVLPRQIRAVSDERLRDYVGRVSNAELKSIVLAVLRHILPPGSDVAIGDYPGLV